MTDSSGVFNPLVRELCQTCGWRGGHGSDCPELDRPGSPLFDFDEIRARLAEQDRIEAAAEASSAGASKVAAATGTAAVPGPVYAGLTLGVGPAEKWMGQWQAGHLCPVPKVREHLRIVWNRRRGFILHSLFLCALRFLSTTTHLFRCLRDMRPQWLQLHVSVPLFPSEQCTTSYHKSS